MKRALLHYWIRAGFLVALGLALLPLAGLCQPPMSCGQTVTGTISAPGQTNLYVFSGNAGEMAEIFPVPISGSLCPAADLYDSDGNKVGTVGCYPYEIRIPLPATGDYIIRVYDGGTYPLTKTGEYVLTLQFSTGRCGTPIACGQTITNTLGSIGEIDAYTFNGDAGDVVVMQVTGLSPNLCAAVSLADPSGNRIGTTGGGGGICNGTSSNIVLTNTGTYTLQVFAWAPLQANIGDYQVVWQRVNNPCNVALPFCSSTTVFSDALLYKFTVPSSENLFVTIQEEEEASSLNGWNDSVALTVGGQIVASASGWGDHLLQLANPTPGEYILDFTGSESGAAVVQVCTNLPVLTLGQWHVGTILRQSGSAWYQVTVPSGQSQLSVAVETIGFRSQLKVYSNKIGGTLVGSASGPTMNLTISSPAAGTYYVELEDSAWIQNGNEARDHMIKADVVSIELPPCTIPIITSMTPTNGGTAGPVTITINGQCLASNATVCLQRSGCTNVCATSLSGTSNRTVNATFDLSTAAPGNWTLVLTNPDTQSATAPTLFTVESGGQANLWSEIVGRSQIRAGQYQTYVIRYGNSGSIDAPWVSVLVTIPHEVSAELSMQGSDQKFTYDANHPPSGADTNASVTVEASIGPVAAGFQGAIVCRLYGNPALSSIGLSAILRTQTMKDAAPFRQTVAEPRGGLGLAAFPHEFAANPNDNAVINIELLDALGAKPWSCEESLFSTMAERHPFFFMKDGTNTLIFTQMGDGCNRRMQQISPDEFDSRINEWLQDPHVDDGYLYCRKNVALVAGSAVVGTNEYAKFLAGLQNAAVSGTTTCLNCMDQPDKIAEAAGIRLHTNLLGQPDGFIPWWAEQFAAGADLFAQTFNIDPGSLPSGWLAIPPFLRLYSWEDVLGCCSTCCTNPPGIDILVVTSCSPEDKYGPSGYDPSGTATNQLKRWITGDRTIDYRIDFWNKEDAPAATVDVSINDQLSSNLNWSTFKFTEIGFLDWRVPLEPCQYFNVDVPNVQIDLSRYYPGAPVVNLVVNVKGTFNSTTGQIAWEFHALDPITRQPLEEPLAGFLPPITTNGWEIGWVDFSALPKAGLPTSTIISNQSYVKFDVDVFKPAPPGGPFVNTIDDANPSSHVLPLAASQTAAFFSVQWTGSDEGAGVRDYTIFVSEDSGSFSNWLVNATGTSGTFTGQVGHTYAFYSIARDNVGNQEAKSALPEATTRVVLTHVLNISKLQTKLNFAKANADTCNLTATLDPGAGFNPAGKSVTLNIGGAQMSFTLDSKGRAVGSPGACRLSYSKSKKVWTLTTKLKSGNYQTAWAAYGMVNANLPQPTAAVKVPVTLLLGQEMFVGERTLTYKAKPGKSGTAK